LLLLVSFCFLFLSAQHEFAPVSSVERSFERIMSDYTYPYPYPYPMCCDLTYTSLPYLPLFIPLSTIYPLTSLTFLTNVSCKLLITGRPSWVVQSSTCCMLVWAPHRLSYMRPSASHRRTYHAARSHSHSNPAVPLPPASWK